MQYIEDYKLGSKETKEYIDKTTTTQQEVHVEESLECGTLKITKKLADQAVTAVTKRIKSVEKYTEARVQRVNTNYRIHYQQKNQDDAVNQVGYPITYSSDEQWIDDLYLLFENLGDAFTLEAEGDVLGSFISKKLNQGESEQQNKAHSVFMSLANQVLKRENIKNDNVYYFQVMASIKKFMQKLLDYSEYKLKIEEFLMNGVVGGMFVFKEDWGNRDKYKLAVHEDTEGSEDGQQYVSTGEFKYCVRKEDVYKFKPVDQRNLIFRKDGMTWVVEKIPSITFSQLLNATLDDEGEPKKNATYDHDMLVRVQKYMKDHPLKETEKWGEQEWKDFDMGLNTDEIDLNEIYEVDGDMPAIECHHIPLIIKSPSRKNKKKKVNKTIKCIITMLCFGEKKIPIRIQPTEFIEVPYKYTQFCIKTGDIAGMGLPEVVEKIQMILNEFTNFAIDMIDMAIWGIVVCDMDLLDDPKSVNSLTPRQVIQLKTMKGRNINEVFQWLRPPKDALVSMQSMFGMLLDILNKITRKGPGTEKITPNPSATEATSIFKEMRKGVNRVGIRLNNLMEKFLENMYVYTIMHRRSMIAMKVDAYTIKDQDAYKQSVAKDNVQEGVNKIIKEIRLTPKELLVDGLGFKVSALDFDQEKQAIEKQQAMQAIDVIYKTIGLTDDKMVPDPTTGQPMLQKTPKVFIDETGAPVEIDEFKLVNQFLKKSKLRDLWKRQDSGATAGQSPPPTGPPAPGARLPKVNNAMPSDGKVVGAASRIK